ncbi:MAG: hypothetical protein Q4G68_10110 [Planctomycetia bacterium]|nr:hypothetical protein [Planctomycetia bacterium]
MKWFYCFLWGGLVVFCLSLGTMVMSASLFSEEKCEQAELNEMDREGEDESAAGKEGEWVIRRRFDAAGKRVFSQAMDGLMGVQYNPVFYAVCQGNPSRYCFICESRIVIPNPPTALSAVYIEVATDGSAKICDIKGIELDDAFLDDAESESDSSAE